MLWAVANGLVLGLWRMRRTLGHRIYGVRHTSELLAKMPSALVVETLEKYGASIGKGVALKGPLWVDNAFGDRTSTGDFSNLRIGAGAFIGKGCFLDLSDSVELGTQAVLSAGVTILTHADCGGRPMSEYYPREQGPVVIGDGAWIGVNATILHGVRIGERAVIAAGAVVRSDVPRLTLAAGVPATLKGPIDRPRIAPQDPAQSEEREHA